MLVVQGSLLEKFCLPAEKKAFSHSILDKVAESWVWALSGQRG